MDKLLERIKRLKVTDLLNPSIANKLYAVVPTPASDFMWINTLVKKRTNDTAEIKVLAYEPTKWILPSIAPWTKSPILKKLGAKKDRLVTRKFAWSKLFSEEDLMTIAAATKSNASDAEVQAARDLIIREYSDLKYRNKTGLEKLFWEWAIWNMNIVQNDNGQITTEVVSTWTTQLPALSSTLKWDDISASSTADPAKDIADIALAYRWTGAKLKKVVMNLETFNFLKLNPKIRETYKHTTLELEKEWKMSIPIQWVVCEVYDGAYIDEDWNVVPFIADWVIIWIWDAPWIEWKWVELVNCINVDATDPESLEVKFVYWEHINITWTKDPVSKKITLSDYTLPVFKNPKMFVSLKVY